MAEPNELRAAAEQRIGLVVDAKFRLVRILGLGGMAVVYEATHRNGKRVALKLLHADLGTSERQRKRFMREAYAANAIAHPGVVQIHDDGIDPESGAYLVMELLEGETVGALQRRHGGRLDLDRVQRIGDQLLDVLTAAHARGVIHRDIKPDNLFITRDGQLKVLDFGIAHLFEHVPGSTFETLPGSMLGTPAFMPQEQARGRWDEVDARSDLWAVGATLFSLISGEHVHMADTSNEQLGRAMTVPARSLKLVRTDLPPAFVTVIDRALRFDPTERWPDARTMQRALRAASAALDHERKPDWDQISTLEETLSAVSDVSRPSEPAKVRTFGTYAKATALVLLVIVGAFGLGWAMLRSEHATPEAAVAPAVQMPSIAAAQPRFVPAPPIQAPEPIVAPVETQPLAAKTRNKVPRRPRVEFQDVPATNTNATTSVRDPLDQRR